MDRKNKGKEAVRVLLIVDDDKSCHLELARMLRLSGYEVTPCKGAKNALDRPRKATSRFYIMITKRNLLDMELLQKVEREMNLFVIAMSRYGGIEAMQNNTITIHGVLKPATMNFLITLWQCVFGKNIRNPAEVQQPTNDVLEEKRQLFKWSPDKRKIFIDCVEELKKEGIDPTPKNIMERMEAKGVKALTIDIVKSHKQKWVKKLEKEVRQSVHVLESLNSATQLPGVPAAMNISSQPHIGALQIMTQPSSSRQICKDLSGGQAFDDGTSINESTNLFANNHQNQDLDKKLPPLIDNPDAWHFVYKEHFADIDSKGLEWYLPKER